MGAGCCHACMPAKFRARIAEEAGANAQEQVDGRKPSTVHIANETLVKCLLNCLSNGNT